MSDLEPDTPPTPSRAQPPRGALLIVCGLAIVLFFAVVLMTNHVYPPPTGLATYAVNNLTNQTCVCYPGVLP